VAVAAGPSGDVKALSAQGVSGQYTELAVRAAGLAPQPGMRPWRWAGGANPDGWWCAAGLCNGVADGTVFVDRELPLIRALGIRLIRLEFPWPLLEPRRKQFDWRRADYIVERAKAVGIEVVPIIVFTPGWARTSANSPPPADELHRFVRTFAYRYRKSVRFYELWNEPDLNRYFNGTARQYVRTVLIPGAQAIRAGDRSSRVILGGPASADEPWLNGIYAAGGGGSFDVLSYHDYSGNDFVLKNVAIVQRVLQAHGQPRKPIWIGEYGTEESGFDDVRQEALMRYALTGAAPLARVIWYTLRDDHVLTCCPPEVVKSETFGLMTDSYQPKRGYATMRQLLTGH
jgi:polysaccharide biosynthesis protein PslG